MFRIHDQGETNCLGVEVSGELTRADYESLLPYLDRAIAAHGEVNLLIVVDKDFEGWADLEAMQADWEFGRHEYRQVRRTAFVSPKRWHRAAVKLMDPFTRHTDEKTFEPDELEAAREWACGGGSRKT